MSDLVPRVDVIIPVIVKATPVDSGVLHLDICYAICLGGNGLGQVHIERVSRFRSRRCNQADDRLEAHKASYLFAEA